MTPVATVTGKTLDFADEPIVRVDPSDDRAVHRALAVLLTGRVKHAAAAVEQFLQFVRQQQVPLDRLWTVGRVDDPRGAVMLAPNPGRTAMMFVSPATRAWQRGAMVRLMRAAIEAEDTSRVTMVQALLDPGQDDEAGALLHAGFERLALLTYMQQRAEIVDRATLDGLRVAHWSEENRSLFERAILASYEQTLDCPGLLGLRTIDDIIAGHMATGTFDPELWSVIVVDDEPAAVMLLSELPEPGGSGGTLELVYLGVSVAYRGKGLAQRLVAHALLTGAARRLRHVILAVDEANTPAMALYRKFGFRATARKLALIIDVR